MNVQHQQKRKVTRRKQLAKILKGEEQIDETVDDNDSEEPEPARFEGADSALGTVGEVKVKNDVNNMNMTQASVATE